MYKPISLILLLNCIVFSNECVVVFGRNDEVVGVQATNIYMREEEIVITLRKDYYEVAVTFDFFNSDTSEKKVQLGFPVEGTFYEFRDDEVYDFETTLNGKVIPVHTTKRESIDVKNGVGTYVKWFIRDATFPANSRTVSRVTYKSRYSDCGNMTTAGYIYGTGRFWKDGIGKMTLIVNHGDDILIDRIDFESRYQDPGAESSEFIWEANGRYKYIFKNVKPRSPNASIYISVQPFDIYGTYGGQFGSNPRNMRGYHINNYHFDYFWSWDEHLVYANPTDIQYYTKNQIRLFINFFFAIHGYDFKNPRYREYFEQIENFEDRNQTKYKVNPQFNMSNFNEIERKNIDYLLNLEKMIPK